MRQTPAPLSTATSSIAASAVRAETSLMIWAPAATASRATAALRVSIETGTFVWRQRASITGMTRRSSSAGPTGCEPGRVLSPPTSIRSAPSHARSSPWWMAAAGSKWRPPSEKLSGVTLRMPISSGRRAKRSVSVRSFQRSARADGIDGKEGGVTTALPSS
jgi:hypothetical protein